jgi:hypothetical protein
LNPDFDNINGLHLFFVSMVENITYEAGGNHSGCSTDGEVLDCTHAASGGCGLSGVVFFLRHVVECGEWCNA